MTTHAPNLSFTFGTQYCNTLIQAQSAGTFKHAAIFKVFTDALFTKESLFLSWLQNTSILMQG